MNTIFRGQVSGFEYLAVICYLHDLFESNVGRYLDIAGLGVRKVSGLYNIWIIGMRLIYLQYYSTVDVATSTPLEQCCRFSRNTA